MGKRLLRNWLLRPSIDVAEIEARLDAVEAMVRDAVDTREIALNSMLDQASGKAASGDKENAIKLYRQVAAQGCVFPRLAKTAQRALRRLGVKD